MQDRIRSMHSRVWEVDGLIADHLELHRLVAHAVSPEGLDATVQRGLGWLVFIEQVSADEHEVTLQHTRLFVGIASGEDMASKMHEKVAAHMIHHSNAHSFIERAKTVVSSDRVFFSIAKVNICDQQDTQGFSIRTE